MLNAVRRVTGRQGGPIQLDQLRDLGIPVRSWVRSGRLIRIERRVYTLGDETLTERGRLMVPVLVCGPDAVLSHRTAGHLWRIRSWRSPIVEVTVPRESIRRPRRTVVHRTRHLPLEHTTEIDGLPVTSVSRTLVDLAEVIERRPLERALDEAHYLGLLDLPSLDAAVEDATGRRGAGRLKAALEAHRPGTTRTRSDLEEAFLALCREHRLPPPQVNHRKGGYEVDFSWPGNDLLVETDGRAAHSGPHAFERDHAKQVELALTANPPLRFTYRQVMERSAWVAAKVREGYRRSRKSNSPSESGSAEGRSKKSGLRQSKASP